MNANFAYFATDPQGIEHRAENQEQFAVLLDELEAKYPGAEFQIRAEIKRYEPKVFEQSTV